MAISDNQFENARRKGKERAAHVSHAVSVRFDSRQRLLMIELSSRAILCIHDRDLQGLAGARARDLQDVELLGDGQAIHFPRLDQSFYLPALLEGFLGTKQWMAELGRKGGQARSDAKQAAARANGRKGGRPRKSASNADA